MTKSGKELIEQVDESLTNTVRIQERRAELEELFKRIPITDGWPEIDDPDFVKDEAVRYHGFAVEVAEEDKTDPGYEEDVVVAAVRLLARNCAQYEAYNHTKFGNVQLFCRRASVRDPADQTFHRQFCWYATCRA